MARPISIDKRIEDYFLEATQAESDSMFERILLIRRLRERQLLTEPPTKTKKLGRPFGAKTKAKVLQDAAVLGEP